MAVCEIWDVRGRLDHPIDYAENPEKTANPKYTEADLQAMVDVMEYATNKDKTEQRYFVTGVNCDPTTARDEMMIAKAQWNDESEIVCYHGFQSFKHGEVTPEQAHEVGVKLAQKMWGDRFQVIVATHLNTDCLHNHFVVNSVSFTDGKHYHDNKANLRLLRQRSDELCREYALSVIEHPSGKKKPYFRYAVLGISLAFICLLLIPIGILVTLIQIAQDTTKTKSSMRTLPLVPAFKEKLLKLKEQQEEYKRVCGRCYNKKYLEYICVDEMGTLISPHYLTSSFPKLLEKNNLRHIRFHDLRHSCASLLLANGVPMKQIQEWLGHSDFSTTANVYAHLDYNSKLSSADAMVNGLSGALEAIS